MKLPFLSWADPLNKRKSEEFPEWYALQVALAIIQALGRSVRSETDWSVIYILDLLWKFFYDKNRDRLFPPYIQAAIRWVSTRYPIPFI
jgi:Rad3-related DNA helicase